MGVGHEIAHEVGADAVGGVHGDDPRRGIGYRYGMGCFACMQIRSAA